MLNYRRLGLRIATMFTSKRPERHATKHHPYHPLEHSHSSDMAPASVATWCVAFPLLLEDFARQHDFFIFFFGSVPRTSWREMIRKMGKIMGQDFQISLDTENDAPTWPPTPRWEVCRLRFCYHTAIWGMIPPILTIIPVTSRRGLNNKILLLQIISHIIVVFIQCFTYCIRIH